MAHPQSFRAENVACEVSLERISPLIQLAHGFDLALPESEFQSQSPMVCSKCGGGILGCHYEQVPEAALCGFALHVQPFSRVWIKTFPRNRLPIQSSSIHPRPVTQVAPYQCVQMNLKPNHWSRSQLSFGWKHSIQSTEMASLPRQSSPRTAGI